MDDVSVMDLVYKYLDPDRLGFLDTGLIRFTPPGALNDPYECLPSVSAGLEEMAMARAKAKVYADHKPLVNDSRSIRRLKLKAAEKNWQLLRQKLLGDTQRFREGFLEDSQRRMNSLLGILSLSTRWNSALMWSHYTRSYTGFCVGFDRNHTFFDATSDPCGDGFGLSDVEYSIDRLVMTEPKLNAVESVRLLLIKSTDWEYEREVRKVAFLHKADQTIKAKPFDVALFKIPQDAISELIVGYRANPEVKRDIISAAKRLRVPCFETRVSRETFDVERVAL